MKDINDIQFEDIVITIPKNTIAMTIGVDVYEDGDIQKFCSEYNLSEINECRDVLEKYIEGELPKYKITEKGLAYLEELEKQKYI